MSDRWHSVSMKFRPGLTVAFAVALLAGGIAIGTYSELAYRQQKLREVSVEADILASTVTAALSFEDRNAAREYVTALKANPEIEIAAVYDSAGLVFADFVRPGRRPPATASARRDIRYAGGHVVATVPVIETGHNIGTVFLEAASEPLSRRVSRYGLLALLVTMASLLVAVLGAGRAALARANAELARRADALADANRTLQAEMEQRALIEARLRQAQKMEAIGQLTGGVAHDFNNILQIIVGNLERLARQTAGAPGRDRAVASALAAADRATKLTQQLLAFSRQQPLNPAPLDVNRLVSNLSSLLSRTLGETIKIETILAPDVAAVAADATQLESALLNLAVNARDAMASGGRLTIETNNRELDAGAAAVHDLLPGPYVQIAVSDTGSGMTPEVMAKAFDPFFTTKPSGRGTGLGLSQVYGFVKQSGGHVEMASEPGRGTRVTLYLPRARDAAAPPDSTRAPDKPPAGRPFETILVVEDDEHVRDYSAGMLRDLGYTVIEVPDGAAALAVLDAGQSVDLLFTDVGLPGINGRELAERARQRQSGIKVLFTSGYAQEALVHGGRLDEGVELLGKPFTLAALAAKVRTVLQTSRQN